MRKIALWFALLLTGAAQTTFSQTGLDPSFAIGGINQGQGRCKGMFQNKRQDIVLFGGKSVPQIPGQFGYTLDKNGSLKMSSYTNGYLIRDTFGFMTYNGIMGVLPQNQNSFLSYTDVSDRTGRLVRFDSNGHVDYNYGYGGVTYLPPATFPVLNTDSQYRVLYAGQCSDCLSASMESFTISRFLPNGQPDSSFAANGRLQQSTTQYAAIVKSVEQTPDGKIVLGENEWLTSWNAYRYLDDGRTDSIFGGTGRVSIFWRKAFSFTRVQPDNKVLFIGYDADSVVVVRVKEDGSWDSSYGNSGIAKAARGIVEQAVVRPDGRLVMGGNVDSTFIVWQLLPDGRIDPNFGHNGVIELKVANEEHNTTGLALQVDGKILLAGQTGGLNIGQAVVARFFADGRLAVQEPKFPENAVQLYPNPTGDVLKVAYPALREAGHLNVYDITGRVMQKSAVGTGSSLTEINVQGLAPGVYIIEVRSGVSCVQKRFVKQ